MDNSDLAKEIVERGMSFFLTYNKFKTINDVESNVKTIFFQICSFHKMNLISSIEKNNYIDKLRNACIVTLKKYHFDDDKTEYLKNFIYKADDCSFAQNITPLNKNMSLLEWGEIVSLKKDINSHLNDFTMDNHIMFFEDEVAYEK